MAFFSLSVFFLFCFFWVGWHLNRWTVCFLFDSTTPQPTFQSSALYRKAETKPMYNFVRKCVCVCACVCMCVSAFPTFIKLSKQSDIFSLGLLRFAIVSFLWNIRFFPMLLQNRYFFCLIFYRSFDFTWRKEKERIPVYIEEKQTKKINKR